MSHALKNTLKRSLPKLYSTALNQVVQSMLEIDPKKRITADKIIQACKKYLNINSEKTTKENDVLMQTIVVPETN